MIPDEKDLRILRAMAELGTGSADEIHEETGIPKSTVHYRITRLREEGILENDLFAVNRDALGLSLTVISEVNAVYEEGYHEQVGSKLAAIDGVNQVYFVMGDTDFVVISHLSSHEMVKDLVESFEGVEEIQRTSSKFVIQTVKSDGSVMLDWDEDAILAALGITDESDVVNESGDTAEQSVEPDSG